MNANAPAASPQELAEIAEAAAEMGLVVTTASQAAEAEAAAAASRAEIERLQNELTSALAERDAARASAGDLQRQLDEQRAAASAAESAAAEAPASFASSSPTAARPQTAPAGDSSGISKAKIALEKAKELDAQSGGLLSGVSARLLQLETSLKSLKTFCAMIETPALQTAFRDVIEGALRGD